MPIFFNSQSLPPPQPEYVAWMDVMGIGPVMGRSLDVSSNFIFKLHIAALQSLIPTVVLYPVMDGLYATSASQQAMLNFLRNVFEQCADDFALTPATNPFHRFIIRGALAFGPVFHGENVPAAVAQAPGAAANVFTTNVAYKNSILVGLPMVQAHLGEKLAPPFGLYVHESARSFSPAGQAPIHFSWWKWGNQLNTKWTNLIPALQAHYQWCRQHSLEIEYELDRIQVHETMANQYFG